MLPYITSLACETTTQTCHTAATYSFLLSMAANSEALPCLNGAATTSPYRACRSLSNLLRMTLSRSLISPVPRLFADHDVLFYPGSQVLPVPGIQATLSAHAHKLAVSFTDAESGNETGTGHEYDQNVPNHFTALYFQISRQWCCSAGDSFTWNDASTSWFQWSWNRLWWNMLLLQVAQRNLALPQSLSQ